VPVEFLHFSVVDELPEATRETAVLE